MVDQPKILWRERDAGQKFSIIMFGACLAASAAFMLYAATVQVERNDWMAVLGPVAGVLSLVGLVFEWRRRNAR